ncbi:MAG: hypothetical protein IKQ49_08255 [Eubacterium sp.]|nr:hypothetical protein [Eubacterium sp.]
MSEKRLTFGEFVDEVRRSIMDYLPEKFADAEVHVDQFQKLNTAYLGMQVKREDQMVVPNINLNGMFAQYQEQGHTMAAMLTMIAQQMGTDFFVLPSSVHEVLILPDDGSQDLESLQFMVREINRTEVAPEDRLSDFVYHYDAQDHVLERAETFAERMAQKEQETEKAALQEPEKTAEPREAQTGDGREPEPEKKEHAAGKEIREGGEKAGHGEERKTSHEAEQGEAGGRKERRSVLGRLNEKKEQVKGQPKKSGPNRAQEASI